MGTFKHNYSNNKTLQPISKDQNSKKPSKDMLSMGKTNKFQLTSKNDYDIIKGNIQGLIIKANETSGGDLKAFIIELGIQEGITFIPNHIALLTNIYTLNEKLGKLQAISRFEKQSNIHTAKSNIYVIRCNLINLIHGLLPQARTTASITEIKKYISKGFNATLNIENILTYLETISLDEIEEFSKLFEEYRKK